MHFTLTDLITDIAQNGAEAGGDLVELFVSEIAPSPEGGEFRFTVTDNGKGMSDEELKRAQDPFVTDGVKHPGRKVGLGLPFLIQTAEASGGGWTMSSRKRPDTPGDALSSPPGEDFGTNVSAWFDLGNVDTPPVGDIPGLFRTVLLFEGPAEMVIHRVRETGGERVDYKVRKTELAEVLGDLEDTQSLILLDRYLRSLEESEE